MSEDNRDPVRAEFEAWILKTYLGAANVEWDANRNCYRHFETHLCWQAWAAAWAAISTPAPSSVDLTERSGVKRRKAPEAGGSEIELCQLVAQHAVFGGAADHITPNQVRQALMVLFGAEVVSKVLAEFREG
jgi:hypothetical protein